jgi:hypothetical protein
MLADRFQGGVFEFAQRLAQMPPDLVDDMMAHAAAEMDQAGGMGQENIFVADGVGMPGGFGDDEEVLLGAPVPVNLPNNNGQGNAPIGDDESDEDENDREEDEEEEEEIAVRRVPFSFNDWSN